MASVLVGCRLPNGHVMNHPARDKQDVTVKLNGACYGEILKPYGLTEVDSAFWDDWKAAHKGSTIYTSGAIFEAKSANDAQAKSKDLGKTGFEKVEQTADGEVQTLTAD